MGRPHYVLIGSSVVSLLFMVLTLVSTSERPWFLWVAFAASAFGTVGLIVSETRRVKRVANDPWSLQPRPGQRPPPGLPWGTPPGP